MESILPMAAGPAPVDAAAHAALPHVLLVVDGFPKALGGGERVLLRQAALLPKYGYRASILTLFWHPESSLQPSDAPCPVYLLPLQRTYDLQALRGALNLRHLLHKQKICLVQTFFESSDLWAGGIARLTSHAKLIWSRRDMGILRGRKHQLAYRWFRRLPDGVFAVSEQVRRHVIETDGVDPAKVRTIYNGVDLPDHIGRRGLAPGTAPKVLTIGNVRRVKGHDILLRAAAIVLRRRPEVVFQIAGEVLEPEYMLHLRALLTELGIENQVRFLGKITDPRPYLDSATLFALSSRSEGFSNALVEAMAYALPVIATDVGGNAEAIEDGVNGLIVPSENVEALANAILRLLASPRQAEAMGAAAQATVALRFSAEAMMDAISDAYTGLLGNRK